jgi:hypothetical protein
MLECVLGKARQLGDTLVAWPPPTLREEDVLGRFAQYAAALPFVETFVRLTADCPLLDTGVSQRIIDDYFLHRETLDFVGTSPALDGLDTEVFSRRALETATIHDHDQREHVTRWMRQALRCKIITFPQPGPLRWSVDDQGGLDFVRRVMQACQHCAMGLPHHSNATGSIGGEDGRAPVWDLHALPDGGLGECTAYDIRMERIGGDVYVSA